VKNLKTGIMWNKHTHEDGTLFTKEEFLQKLKTDKEFNNEFGNKGIDQISELIRLLKETPDSRRMVVNAWAVHDLPNQVLPPCHYGFQVYTRELSLEERLQVWNIKFGFTNEEQKNQFDPNVHLDTHGVPTRAISLMWNQRSVDTFLGLPFNIASYGLLLEILAKEVNMVPDELIGNLGDTHLYLNHIEQAKEQIGREPYTLPTLNINTEFWPTESGECGTGLLDVIKIFNSFTNDNFCKCLLEEDIQLSNYKSHEKINAPLSN
jgi:thymidylate synthase